MRSQLFANVLIYPLAKVGMEVGKAMARSLQKLSDVLVKSTKLKAGRHSDGGGLYLNVTPGGSKSWLYMWTVDGKRREMGLGPYPAVTLANARSKASDARQAVAEGRDPIAEKAKDKEPTFGVCADQYIESMEKQWKNAKHRDQWRMTLKDYCEPIRSKMVSEIGVDDVLKVLKSIWSTKNDTASRLRGRIERVLGYAKAKGWRRGENPAAWRDNLANILPSKSKLTRGHHAAMGYNDVPGFVSLLREHDGISAKALEFLILNANRTGEVLGAKWDEVDMVAKIWTIPGERMKSGREHRVPLSEAALSVLHRLHNQRFGDNPYIFPGQKKDRPLSNMSLTMVIRRMKIEGVTVHGFRSAFRDWAGDKTSFPREVAEAALAHTVGDETERAYRRSDAIEKRRKLMDAWEKYITLTKRGGNVLKFPAAS